VGLAAFTVSSGYAQTQDSAQAALLPEAPPAPARAAAMPAPTPASAGDFVSRPAYGTAYTATDAEPAPTPAPLVAPEATTPKAPFTALPAYNNSAAERSSSLKFDTPSLFTSWDKKSKIQPLGSTYIPVDSWIYPAMVRLQALGYVDTMFVTMRPWTQQSVLNMLDASTDDIRSGGSDEAQEILAAMYKELREEMPVGSTDRGSVYGVKSVYTRVMGISGTSLRDSYHIGQTIENDYGRPYQPGFNNLTGFSTIAEKGRFSLYFRGEYQHSPAATGYSQALSAQFSALDLIPYSGFNLNQATIPTGPIAAQNPFRIVEATLSFHLLGDEISGGKSDAWLGPAQGGSMAWSNNAENIYSFKIDRVEPLHIPYLSAVLGPFRYEFHYGSLKGHTDPNSPYVHSAMVAAKPTRNLEFSFQRTVIFGGEGHVPVTLHTFLRSFFSLQDTEGVEATKFDSRDPGARFSDFGINYRLPFVRDYASFYVDSFVHDDVTPVSAPRRAAFRTGVYISHFKALPKLDLRVEAADTDCRTSRCTGGAFYYFEGIQVQGYTNKGFLFGDPIGREGKGGHAWITYHLSGNESIGLEYLNKKNDNDFIANGTTQNQFKATVTKRFLHDNLEMNAWFQYERWKAPIYLPGARNDTVTAVQLTFYPGLKTKTN
jgi:hypothetical protein